MLNMQTRSKQKSLLRPPPHTNQGTSSKSLLKSSESTSGDKDEVSIGVKPLNLIGVAPRPNTDQTNYASSTNRFRSPVRISLPDNASSGSESNNNNSINIINNNTNNQDEDEHQDQEEEEEEEEGEQLLQDISAPSSPAKSNSSKSSPVKEGVKIMNIGVKNYNNSLLRRNSTTTNNSTGDHANNKTKATSFTRTPNNGSGVRKFNVLVAATGSVAAVKLIDLIKKLKSMFPQTFVDKTDRKTYKATISIKVVMTENSKHFVGEKQIIESLNDHSIDIHDDVDEWTHWGKMGDPVLHIELRKWADIMVIAPLDANTMAKMANGICDNLLTCIVRAWDISKKLIYCPAMNVHMYNHPITRDHLAKLQSFGYLRVDCIEKRLACGDIGLGAMATVDSIAEKIIGCLLQTAVVANSPTKPLLNQQPTYPIISTNTATSPLKFPPANSSIFDRFKTNSQVTLHAVGGGPRVALPTHTNASINRMSLLQKQKQTATPPMNLALGRRGSLDKNSLAAPALRTYSVRSNLVTSLQNLHAVNSDEAPLDEDQCAEDMMELSTPEDEEEEYEYNDFDPSNMMEQSLITDDSIFSNDQSANLLSQQSNGSSAPGVSFNGTNQVDNLVTPFFNAQKFLALCHDKVRNCFTCAICKNDYKNRKSMARHLKEQHVQGNIFQCLSCGVAYKRREKLIKHNKERHGTDQLCRFNYMKPKSRQ